jgi:hypothetical protein
MSRGATIGNKYGKLLVVSEHSKTRNGHIRFMCQCDCGSTCNVLGTHLIQGNTTSCGCDYPKGCTHPKWEGYGDISGNFWNDIYRSAEGVKGTRKKLPLTITKEYAWNLFIEQHRKCALSEIPLCFPKTGKDRSGTASLDRIDSSEGYIEGNVQWVHKDVNKMKNVFDNQYFINVCKCISDNNS